MILQVAKRIVNVWRVPSSKALSCKHERLFDLLTLASPSSYIGQSISDSSCSHKLRLTADGTSSAPAEKVDVVVEVAALDIGLRAPDAQKNRLARKRLFRVGQKKRESSAPSRRDNEQRRSPQESMLCSGSKERSCHVICWSVSRCGRRQMQRIRAISSSNANGLTR